MKLFNLFIFLNETILPPHSYEYWLYIDFPKQIMKYLFTITILISIIIITLIIIIITQFLII